VAPLIPPRASVIDLGSGGGLPGIVLALLLPRARLTLLEPLARRVEFLTECVGLLGLENVDVMRGRAEDMSGELSGDVVTARAVAPLERLSALSLGLARPGGIVLAIKGSSAEAELARALPGMRRLGVSDAEVLRIGGDEDGATATVVRFTVPAQRTVRGGTGRQGGSGRRGRQNPAVSGTAGPARALRGRPNSRRSGG
jgi:16S rRNA (guanine527-N7)-methyltransferase